MNRVSIFPHIVLSVTCAVAHSSYWIERFLNGTETQEKYGTAYQQDDTAHQQYGTVHQTPTVYCIHFSIHF